MSQPIKNVPAWQCPFCGHHQLSADKSTFAQTIDVDVGKPIPEIASILIWARRCLNSECNHLSLSVTLNERVDVSRIAGGRVRAHKRWPLLPESRAKPHPDYIPEPLREDYLEACQIRDKSPKASATLARRCLQGMIRDFCGITKPTLFKEIEELRKRVDEDRAPKGVEHETMDAIDAVREIGNIGAHMEKDINLIVEVDPGEAQALIELIEMLFEDWYVARHDREARLARIKGIAADKKAAKLAKPEEPLQIEAVDVAQITDQSDAD